jgi:hypothetical protein
VGHEAALAESPEQFIEIGGSGCRRSADMDAMPEPVGLLGQAAGETHIRALVCRRQDVEIHLTLIRHD